MDKEFLSRTPSDEEIFLTIKKTPSKSLGLDRLTGFFYKFYWEIIKLDLIKAIKISSPLATF